MADSKGMGVVSAFDISPTLRANSEGNGGEMRLVHRMTSSFAVMLWGVLFLMGLTAPARLAAQATISTGSIQGTIVDQRGGIVAGAKVTITNKATGQVFPTTTNSTGAYNVAALIPGDYTIHVEFKGFKAIQTGARVEIGVISTVDLTLEVGSETAVVEVQASAVAVNTSQAAVSGVVTTEQIENLPLNGRNFLDLAQLEPGVQIQDGNNFDPTKVGYSSISFGGRFGRTARIEVDGVDVSDETVGTTTENIPAGALSEFQISQSTLDLTNELTSSGSVNTITKSGSNEFHGEALYLFRDSRIAAALPGPKAPYQRNHMEGNLGGWIVKDKLFFFGDGLRIKQDLFAPVPLPDPFTALSGGFSSPFRENDAFGRLDWNGPHGVRMFYRYSYFSDLAVSTFGAISFQPFKDKNYTRQNVVGADFSTGTTTHSVRFSYLKFQNDLGDVVRGSSLLLANFPVSINVGPLSTGPNLLAPQTTPQSNRQVKYDGSKAVATHVFRYGISFNHIQGGGFAKFFSITPSIFSFGTSSEIAAAATGPFPALVAGDPNGKKDNPLNYPFDLVFVGNGLGFSTEHPAFGFPLGGLGPDNRLGLYAGDSWRLKPYLTLTYGVRYVRDTGRTDSDLPAIPALNALLPGLGNPVRQANTNFGPQVGIAWDPRKNGKTVIRAGGGVFYENVIYNNVLFDRPERLPKGGFLSFPLACVFGVEGQVPFADGTLQSLPAGTCSDIVGNVANTIAAFQGTPSTTGSFQGVATTVGGNATNSNFLGNLIANGSPIPLGGFAPNYRTPRSFQMNAGIQRELRPGLILTVDYIRNVSLHYLLGIDANHNGDVRFFNKTAAQTAIATTLSNCGVTTIDQSIVLCPLDPANGTNDKGMYIPRAATMADYAGNGLDSPGDLGVGACGIALGIDCAFPGIQPGIGPAPFLFPIGRGVYNAMDVKLQGNVDHPVRGVKHTNFQFAYALSRFRNSGGGNTQTPGASDQDFVISAVDNRNPLRFTGDSTLDRRHQISFGGYADLPRGFQLGTTLHFYSPLAATLTVPNTGLGPGEIFRTDFTGDGTVQDLLPGTHVGSFQRDITAGSLNAALTNYNNTIALGLTPAGQVLVQNGLFTPTQLGVGDALCYNNPNGLPTNSLCATAPTVPLAPKGQVGMFWFKVLDLRISWSYKVKERYKIEPSVGFFNVLNFANFDPAGAPLNGLLGGTAGTVNGTTYNDQAGQRIGVGTGTFAGGSPRTIEFGLRISF
jgi:hypothetical protein